MAGFQVIDASFHKVLGHNAQLRKLLKHPQGVQLFHEAGVLVTDENSQDSTVLITSNRLPCSKHGQRAAIVHLPVAALPPPEDTAAASDDSPEERIYDVSAGPSAEKLWAKLQIVEEPAGGHLAMPNGGCPWRLSDGTNGALICEQGHHGRHGQQDVHAALVEWSPRSQTSKPILDRDAQGRPFSSLNDVAVHEQSGCVFFTDPQYGIEQGFKRSKPSSGEEYARSGLYVWDPKSNETILLDDNYDKPNGVTFVPDPTSPSSGKGLLMTTDTGRFHFRRANKDAFNSHDMGDFTVDDGRPARIFAYPVDAAFEQDGKRQPKVHVEQRMHFADSQAGVPDGIHHDELGNVWVGHGDGVHIYRPHWDALSASDAASQIASAGKLIGKIVLPDNHGVANFCWAGPVSTQSLTLYRVILFAEDELWEALVEVNGHD